jgi:predicted membrane channel-forming protein YqfA (hemolysin III family)
MMSRLGNWFFLVGSLLFTFDAFLNWYTKETVQALVLLIGSLFFTIGCILFILDMPTKVHLRR